MIVKDVPDSPFKFKYKRTMSFKSGEKIHVQRTRKGVHFGLRYKTVEKGLKDKIRLKDKQESEAKSSPKVGLPDAPKQPKPAEIEKPKAKSSDSKKEIETKK